MVLETKDGWHRTSRPDQDGLVYIIKSESFRPYPTWLIDYDPNNKRAAELLSMWTREGTVRWITREEYCAS